MSKWFRDSDSRIMLFGLLAVSLICGFVVVSSYQTQIKIYEDKELAKLWGIASTLVLQINGDDHAQLTRQYPDKDDITLSEQDAHYEVMHVTLKEAKKKNDLREAIYTMVYNEEKRKFCFAATSSETPYWMHAYKDFPKELIDNYDQGGALPPYEDENGHWLSAYSPIKDSEGRTVALLQVDEQFDTFLMMARAAAWKNILFSFIVVAILGTLMLLFIRSILRNQTKLQLERLAVEQQRRELTANISHDLRTPLSSIQGYVETILLKKDSLGAEREKKYLETALHNTNKLKKLVDQLFELSRLESKHKQLVVEPFNVMELLYDTANSLNLSAKERHMELTVVQSANEVPLVMGDLAEIDRVLQNLIGNALEHGIEGQKISLSLEVLDDCVRVTVEDNGPGIESAELAHVFERFSSMKQDTNGSGLGLAIVKQVLNLHKANYALESEEGHGTRFWFDLDMAGDS